MKSETLSSYCFSQLCVVIIACSAQTPLIIHLESRRVCAFKPLYTNDCNNNDEDEDETAYKSDDKGLRSTTCLIKYVV